jgi:1,4-dihydroxy-6-naphthoate synthase
MKITLGFSPCPNDTFVFDALVHGRIDTEGLDFEVVMADVEQLNQMAFSQKLDVTKLSYHAFAYLTGSYTLLDAGSALGNKCGPLLVAKQHLAKEEIIQGKIAIPGMFTTANFLLSLAYPEVVNKEEVVFSEIENAVLSGNAVAGLVIHENRFTFQNKGLVKIVDLGEFWESCTGLPIPLGGIAVKKQFPIALQRKINRLMASSVLYAQQNPEASRGFVKKHAQEMEEDVIQQHISLYVNNFTLALGKTGRTAIKKLFEMAKSKEVIPSFEKNIFIH